MIKKKTDKIMIEIISGVEGNCIVINNYRVAGNKPWGGGQVIDSYQTTVNDILQSLNIPIDAIDKICEG